MAKPKNVQSREYIEQAAYQLFLDKGYDDTTYQDISSLCGCQRTTVQHYFPKKTLLIISFFEKLLTEIREYIKDRSFETDNSFINLFLVGQYHFGFLLKDTKTIAFTFDIISSRVLTDEILLLNSKWGLDFLEVQSPRRNDQLMDDITFSMGGFYELMYQCLKNKRDFNTSYHLSKVIISIMSSLGHSRESSEALIHNHSLTSKQVIESNEVLEAKFKTKLSM